LAGGCLGRPVHGEVAGARAGVGGGPPAAGEIAGEAAGAIGGRKRV
jgi:hypothetical protein